MFPNFILLLVPKKYEEETRHILSKSNHLLSRYFLGLLCELTSVITLLSIGLSILGIENAIIIGFLGGILNIVPYLGPLIGGTMGVMIGVTTALSLGMFDMVGIIAIEVICVFVIANLIDNIVLQPLIYSKCCKSTSCRDIPGNHYSRKPGRYSWNDTSYTRLHSTQDCCQRIPKPDKAGRKAHRKDLDQHDS